MHGHHGSNMLQGSGTDIWLNQMVCQLCTVLSFCPVLTWQCEVLQLPWLWQHLLALFLP